MCFFLCPATEESDRMSESGGYLRFDNFFNCLHFNGNHHQLKTYGEFLLFLVFPNFLKKVVICQQKQIVFKFTYSLLLLHINRNHIQSKKKIHLSEWNSSQNRDFRSESSCLPYFETRNSTFFPLVSRK